MRYTPTMISIGSDAGGQGTATTEGRTGSDKKSAVQSVSRSSKGGGPNTGRAYILSQIEPATLPEEDVWAEVARRIRAYEEDRDGWRTGDIDTSLDDYRGGSP